MIRDRLHRLWLVLVVATTASWLLGTSREIRIGQETAAIVLAIAFLKVRWIGLDFMELRYAPRPLRLFFEAWVLVVGSVVVISSVVN